MAGDIQLGLQQSDDLVVLTIVNISDGNVRVSRLFTQNPAFGLLEFDVSVDGKRFGPLTPPNENFPVASDYVNLAPFDVTGRAFYISEIRKHYRVSSGCFYLSIKYHDVLAEKFMAFSKTIESNKIRICEK
jgi:hypothetical protein